MEVVGVAVPVQSQRVPKSWNIPDTGPWHVPCYNLSEPLFSHLQSGDSNTSLEGLWWVWNVMSYVSGIAVYYIMSYPLEVLL